MLKDLNDGHFVVNENEDGREYWTVLVGVIYVEIRYIESTDVIEMKGTIMNKFRRPLESDPESEVENLLSLYQTLLGGAVFGYKTAGGSFCVERNDGEVKGLQECDRKYRLVLRNIMKLNRKDEHSFVNTGLKDVLPIFAQQVITWKKLMEPWMVEEEEKMELDMNQHKYGNHQQTELVH